MLASGRGGHRSAAPGTEPFPCLSSCKVGYNVRLLRRSLAVLAIVCASFAFVASAGAASGDLRIGSAQPFDSPNPFQSVLATSVDAEAFAYYDQLIGLKTKDQSIDWSAGLATGADVAKDGKTITFHLRKGVHWSDGVPFTSADALWTFNAVLDNKTNQLHTTISAVKSASAPDAYTLVLHLTTRDSEFLQKLALPILPKHVWSKIPIAKLDKVSGPIPTVTTAPWMLTQWHKNATTIMVRNPKYDLFRNGGKEPAVKRILMTTYQNTDSVYRDVAQGNLDVAFNGPVDWAPRAKRAKNLRLVSAPRGGYWEIAFNSCPLKGSTICSGPAPGVKVKVVQDPAIRKALAYGINREQFPSVIFQNQAATAYGLISPRFKLYYEDLSKEPAYAYAYNPAKAKQILQAGGWNCSATPCTKNGVKAEFELATLSDSKQDQQMAQRAAADALKLGIKIDLAFISEDALNNRIYASGKSKDTYAPNYDTFLWDWDVGGVTPTPILEVLRSFDASSDSFYDSKAFDNALLRAKQATTQAGTVAAVRQAAKIELGDLPYLPLVHENAIDVIRKDTWHGWIPSPAPDGEPLFQTSTQLLALQPGPAPVATGQPEAVAASTDSGWLTTPRSVLIGSILISLAIIGSSFISSGRRRTEPLEWTEE
jgi:peptide/nickel transport system substrate-binding protein